MIPTFKELIGSIKGKVELTYTVLKQAKYLYEIETKRLREYAEQGLEVGLSVFEDRDVIDHRSQLTAYFYAIDNRREYDPTHVNWHGQNLSQVRYNGAFLLSHRNEVTYYMPVYPNYYGEEMAKLLRAQKKECAPAPIHLNDVWTVSTHH